MRPMMLLVALLTSMPAAAAVSDCARRLMRVMERISPSKEARLFGDLVAVPTAPARLEVSTLLKSEAEVQVAEQGPLKLSIKGAVAFVTLHHQLRRKGFWMIMNPNPASQSLTTGHASILIGDHLFNRLHDDLGPEAMRSVPVQDVAALFLNSADTPYLVAQFYEVSESSLATLEKFYHDRVWFYHQGRAAWRPRYERLPLSPEKRDTDCENCSLFSWSFLDPKWSARVPELGDVQAEVGQVLVDQIPIKQLYNNTQSAAYRATVLISKEPETLRTSLRDGSFSEDPVGAQTLFHEFKEILKPAPGP